MITSVLWNKLSGSPVDHRGAETEAGRPNEEATAASRFEMSGSGDRWTDPRVL